MRSEVVTAQPSIFIARSVTHRALLSALSAVFKIPEENVLLEGYPPGLADNDYVRLFRIGCIAVYAYEKGDAQFLLEPMLAEEAFTAAHFSKLSLALGVLVAVDFSKSDSEPYVLAWEHGRKIGLVDLRDETNADDVQESSVWIVR